MLRRRRAVLISFLYLCSSPLAVSPATAKVADDTLFYARGKKVLSIEADGTGKRRIYVAERGRNIDPEVSPDGSRLMFAFTTGGGSLGLKVVGSDGIDPRTVAPKRWQVGSWTWAGDGSRLIFSAYQKDRRGVYVANADGSGRTRIYTKPIGGEAVLNREGSVAAFTRYGRNEVGKIMIWRASDDSVTQLPLGDIDASGPAFSPADNSLTFFGFVQDPAHYPLYRVDADGSNLVQLSAPGASAGNAQWSPDGSLIAFSTCCTDDTDPDEIHVVGSDGSDDRVLARDSDSANRQSSLTIFPFSPDGTLLAYEDFAYNEDTFRTIYNKIYTLDLAGVATEHSSDGAIFFQQWAPDSERFIACEYSRDGIAGARLFSIAAPGPTDLLPVCDIDWDRRDNPYGP